MTARSARSSAAARSLPSATVSAWAAGPRRRPCTKFGSARPDPVNGTRRTSRRTRSGTGRGRDWLYRAIAGVVEDDREHGNAVRLGDMVGGDRVGEHVRAVAHRRHDEAVGVGQLHTQRTRQPPAEPTRMRLLAPRAVFGEAELVERGSRARRPPLRAGPDRVADAAATDALRHLLAMIDATAAAGPARGEQRVGSTRPRHSTWPRGDRLAECASARRHKTGAGLGRIDRSERKLRTGKRLKSGSGRGGSPAVRERAVDIRASTGRGCR